MVRVFLKGGVWKNSEDEILKAAVQKYGKQQWARVASLLNRKSAKQCKARWHEWLDPSVRKVEWSREEEEKLLHLAKLMPAQWKTIGPLVGRTATQCQEHYEKLLDEAATAAGGGDGEGDATSSLRAQAQQQLRPGQIDSHPETKPARPDPIDMDEDEIEMLQEARARLANTQGKKAKRKAREKMLAEAKRLADLQKRRELKQAGLLSSQARKKAKKRNRDIDLGVEIPFHKPAPAGFHDVSSEDSRAEAIRAKHMNQIDFKKLNESQYRSRDRDAAAAKKREEARLRTLEKSNMQYAVAQVSKKNDPLNIRKRGPLQLPEPTVTDQELGQMAKLEQTAARADAAAAALSGGDGATQALLGDYTDRPLPTPMRTPMTASGSSSTSKQQNIMREASNLRMLERGQTPLLGEDNPALLEKQQQLVGLDDEDSKKPAATPAADRLSAGAQTPGGASVFSRRDQLGLNRPVSELRGGTMDDSASVGASTFATSTNMSIRDIAREEKRAAKRARKQLEQALAALPAPQFEYELAAPADMDLGGDDEDKPVVESVEEEDAADIEAAEQKRVQEKARKMYEARSSVVKRKDLPRPAGAIPESMPSTARDDAESLIDQERWALLRHDAHAFPVELPAEHDVTAAPSDKKSKKKKKKGAKHGDDDVEKSGALPPEAPLDIISERALNEAKELIQKELEAILEEKKLAVIADGRAKSESDALEMLISENETVSKLHAGAMIYRQSDGWVDKGNDGSKYDSMTLDMATSEFDTLQEATAALRKKNMKVESKLAVLNGGYEKRAQAMTQNILQMFADTQNAVIEEDVYKTLQQNEEMGAVRRIDRLRQDISRLEQDEAKLQLVYQNLVSSTQGAETADT